MDTSCWYFINSIKFGNSSKSMRSWFPLLTRSWLWRMSFNNFYLPHNLIYVLRLFWILKQLLNSIFQAGYKNMIIKYTLTFRIYISNFFNFKFGKIILLILLYLLCDIIFKFYQIIIRFGWSFPFLCCNHFLCIIQINQVYYKTLVLAQTLHHKIQHILKRIFILIQINILKIG